MGRKNCNCDNCDNCNHNHDIINKKLDEIIENRREEISPLGLLFIITVTLVINLWAQYIYNNYVTNFGYGTRNGTDSNLLMIILTIIAISVIIIFIKNIT